MSPFYPLHCFALVDPFAKARLVFGGFCGGAYLGAGPFAGRFSLGLSLRVDLFLEAGQAWGPFFSDPTLRLAWPFRLG